MLNYDLNPDVNKTPPDPANLLPGQVIRYHRKSNKEGRAQASIEQQTSCTMRICERYGLPTSEADIYDEPIGAKGDWWWEGGGNNGLEDLDPNRKVRHQLTKALRAVKEGRCRCICVFHLDRLFRDVEIAKALIMFLYRHDCLLYSYEGFENIWTHQGRNAILQNAISQQALSENSRINSPRGVRQNLEAGKLVVSPNVLGFRSKAKRSCEVLHIPEEQNLVNRIYVMCDGGMSTQNIADTLQLEGVRLYEGTGGKNPHGNKRTEANKHRIYLDDIRKILTDCRYVGRQRWNGDEYECDAFLREVEGNGELAEETVVPVDLWNRVQTKLQNQRRTGNRAVNKRMLAGLVRCGIDGTVLNAQECPYRSGNEYWIVKSNNRPRTRNKKVGERYTVDDAQDGQEIGICTHKMPSIRVNVLDDYICDIFAPMLSEELRDRATASEGRALAAQRVQLETEIRAKEHFRQNELPKYVIANNCSPQLAGQLERQINEQIFELSSMLDDVSRRETSLRTAPAALADLRNCDEGLRRDIVRACIVWIAVFYEPSDRVPRMRDASDKYSYAPERIGKIVVLSAWGTYSTAQLCRIRGEYVKGFSPLTIQPAQLEDAVGGVNDFPDPNRFYEGLRNSWEGRVYRWSPSEFAPGYQPHQQLSFPEFDLNGVQLNATDTEGAV
jgi:DNA invertase Pin-like site-specific DNA recombinase